MKVMSVCLGDWRGVGDKEVLPQGWFKGIISSACGYTVLHQAADILVIDSSSGNVAGSTHSSRYVPECSIQLQVLII
jgi:hypothetical protein